jgi:tripartite-type tricarboxylate transporter receptor subunit TctC
MKAMWFRASIAAVTVLLTLATTPVVAQTFPGKRPITIVIGVPAGGGADTIARLLGPRLTEALGQPIIVEPRPGGNFVPSVRAVNGAAADGHTLLMATSGYSMIAAKPNPPFDLIRDFTPITQVATGPAILVTRRDLPVASVADLIGLAKASPGKLMFGSGGTGTLFHLAGELFKHMTNVNLMHVPYKGSVPALQDVMGAHIDLVFDNLGSVASHAQSGDVKALAVTSATRAASLPDVPTFAELGYADFNVSQWFGLLAPPNLPPEIVARLHAEVAKAVAAPDVIKRLHDLGNDPVGSAPAIFKQTLEREVARWGQVIRDGGLTLQ